MASWLAKRHFSMQPCGTVSHPLRVGCFLATVDHARETVDRPTDATDLAFYVGRVSLAAQLRVSRRPRRVPLPVAPVPVITRPPSPPPRYYLNPGSDSELSAVPEEQETEPSFRRAKKRSAYHLPLHQCAFCLKIFQSND